MKADSSDRRGEVRGDRRAKIADGVQTPWGRTILYVCLVATVMVITFAFYAFFAREVTQWMEGQHHWFHDYEPWSLFGLMGAFIVATACFLPAQPFVVMMGYLFGMHFLTVLFTYFVYALAAFLMFNGARYWFRPMVEASLREHRVVEGMRRYVKDPREGAKVNLLFSFTPMAFCLHCYAMGITEINEFIFLGTFLVGQSPHVFFGIMTGSALLAAEKSSMSLDYFKVGMLIAGVLGTFVAIVYLGSVAQDVLRQMEEETAAEQKGLLGCGARRCGVGITFEEWDGGLLAVTAVAPGSPAARSGEIAVGDELEEIDGARVRRAAGSIDMIFKQIPGKEGSVVVLGLRRPDKKGGVLRRIKLTRCPAVRTYGACGVGSPVAQREADEPVVAGGSTAVADINPQALEAGGGDAVVTVQLATGAAQAWGGATDFS